MTSKLPTIDSEARRESRRDRKRAMNDIIKQAVELADRWSIDYIDGVLWIRPPVGFVQPLDSPDQPYLDALAAQLVRQVDALRPEIYEHLFPRGHLGPDRTMNTIRAIVESGVLDGKGETWVHVKN